MSADRLCTGTSGNISIYVPEKSLMAISPSGIGYFNTRPEDVVVTDLEANIVEGDRKPSSEWALHTLFYKNKPHIRAVVHTHSMYCTTFAVLGQPLQAVHYAIADAGAAEIPSAPWSWRRPLWKPPGPATRSSWEITDWWPADGISPGPTAWR